MAQAALLTAFTFFLSASVAFSITMLTLRYQAKALKLERRSRPKQNLGKEIDQSINNFIIPATIIAIILAGILLVWFWLILMHPPAMPVSNNL